MPQRIGYARVSRESQNLDRQLVWFESLNLDAVYTEKQSGKNIKDRPVFKKVLSVLNPGDILYVESLSRIARSNRDLLNILYDLDEKDIQVISENDPVDMKSKQGRFLISVIGGAAQLERETILESQLQGVAAAKKRGKFPGRARIMDSDEVLEALLQWTRNENSIRQLAVQCQLSEYAFRKRIKEYGLNQEDYFFFADLLEKREEILKAEKKRFSATSRFQSEKKGAEK